MEFQRTKEADFEGTWTPQPAQEKDLTELAAMIFDSELGRKYYPTEKTLLEKMQAACQNSDRIMVVREKEKICGMLWFQMKGAFGMYPYLHLIFIPDSMKGNGVGRELMRYLEYYALNGEGQKIKSRIFLTAGSWNEGAIEFYDRLGYTTIGVIPSLFRKNVEERLLMKVCNRVL